MAAIKPPSGRERSRARLRGIAYMVAAVFIFSIMDALMKRLSAHYGPMQISCLRCLSSWLLLLPIASQRSFARLQMTNMPLHLFRAALGIGMLGSFVFAVHRLSLAQTYALFLAAPLLMTALSVPVHGEKVTGRRWLAILAGLGGVLVILQPWGGGGRFSLIAAAAAAVATLCYSLNALTVRTLGRTNGSFSMVFWYLLSVGIGCGLLAIGDWRPMISGDWVWLAAVGVTGALGQLWLTVAFRSAPPSVVGPFEYTAILWAFGIDAIFWSVSPSLSLVLGTGIVVASGLVVIIDERRLGQIDLNEANPPP